MDVIVLRPQGTTLKPQASKKQKEIFNSWQKIMSKNERKYVKTTKIINRVALGIFIVAVVIFIIGLVK